jgi:hypothetical protein
MRQSIKRGSRTAGVPPASRREQTRCRDRRRPACLTKEADETSGPRASRLPHEESCLRRDVGTAGVPPASRRKPTRRRDRRRPACPTKKADETPQASRTAGVPSPASRRKPTRRRDRRRAPAHEERRDVGTAGVPPAPRRKPRRDVVRLHEESRREDRRRPACPTKQADETLRSQDRRRPACPTEPQTSGPQAFRLTHEESRRDVCAPRFLTACVWKSPWRFKSLPQETRNPPARVRVQSAKADFASCIGAV